MKQILDWNANRFPLKHCFQVMQKSWKIFANHRNRCLLSQSTIDLVQILHLDFRCLVLQWDCIGLAFCVSVYKWKTFENWIQLFWNFWNAMSSSLSIENIETLDDRSFSDVGIQVDLISHHSFQNKSQHFVDLGMFWMFCFFWSLVM